LLNDVARPPIGISGPPTASVSAAMPAGAPSPGYARRTRPGLR